MLRNGSKVIIRLPFFVCHHEGGGVEEEEELPFVTIDAVDLDQEGL